MFFLIVLHVSCMRRRPYQIESITATEMEASKCSYTIMSICKYPCIYSYTHIFRESSHLCTHYILIENCISHLYTLYYFVYTGFKWIYNTHFYMTRCSHVHYLHGWSFSPYSVWFFPFFSPKDHSFLLILKHGTFNLISSPWNVTFICVVSVLVLK